MDFTHFNVNWIGVVLAAVASMILGMVWYMGLSKQWIAATGKTREQLLGDKGPAMAFIIAFVCQLVMAYFLALLTPALTGGATSVSGAVVIGVHMWLGFIITSMVLNHRYQNMSWKLTLIDGGYLLGVMIVQGVVIGLFG